MRLLAFNEGQQPRIGALSDAGVVNLSRIDAAAPTDLGAVVKAGKLADIAAILARADGAVHHQLGAFWTCSCPWPRLAKFSALG